MNTKIAVILTVLVMLSLGMAVFILKDYVTIGKPAGEEEVEEETAKDALDAQPEGEGAQTTLVAAATTAAGGTTAAGATTAAPATTTAGATTTTAVQATTAATTQSLNITTTKPSVGGLVTTSTAQAGIGVLVTTTAAGGKADLVILPGGASVAFPNVKAGDTVTLSGWTVKNQGSAPSGPFKNGFYLASNRELTSDRIYLQGNSNISLAPGEQYPFGSSNLYIPATLTPGIYYIGVLVDRDNEVSESNETNNYISVEIIVSL